MAPIMHRRVRAQDQRASGRTSRRAERRRRSGRKNNNCCRCSRTCLLRKEQQRPPLASSASGRRSDVLYCNCGEVTAIRQDPTEALSAGQRDARETAAEALHQVACHVDGGKAPALVEYRDTGAVKIVRERE